MDLVASLEQACSVQSADCKYKAPAVMDYNWPSDQVDMIVVTDGSRIMGLGDLGVQGINIAIGKLDLYIAAAGINPQRVILLHYSSSYYFVIVCHQLIHLLICASYHVMLEPITRPFLKIPGILDCKNTVLKFEDFQAKWASMLLNRYRNTYRMFNDDVQGTTGVAVAGLLGAVRAQDKMMIDFPKQNIVVAGAGSKGVGVLKAARRTMARILGNNKHAFKSARSQFWVVDVNGRSQWIKQVERVHVYRKCLPYCYIRKS